MAQTVQIQCINKEPRNDPYTRITHVGGFPGNNGAPYWKITLDQAIAYIENGQWQFFVSVNGKSVWVHIATSRSGRKYLKTENDSDEPNNLLSLPECP
jgi:hypothetical protein